MTERAETAPDSQAPARPRRRPSATLIAALVVLAVAVAGRVGYETWPGVADWWECQRLGARLRDPDAARADSAAAKLVEFGTAAAPVFLDALRDPDPAVRGRACRNLWGVRSDPRAAAVALAGALGDAEANVRVAAARAFRYEPSLIEFFDRDESSREAVLSQLAANLNDPDAPVRAASADVLGAFGLHASGSAEGLKPLLGDADPDVRASAACALLRVPGAGDGDPSRALLDLLAEPPDFALDRSPILLALRGAGSEVRVRAASALTGHLGPGRFEARAFAVALLRELGADGGQAVPALENLVGEIKPGAVESPRAEEALNLRADAALALLAIEPTGNARGSAALLDAIADPRVGRDRRWAAWWILRRNDPWPLKLVVGPLVEMASGGDPAVRADAIEMLRRVEPKALASVTKAAWGTAKAHVEVP